MTIDWSKAPEWANYAAMDSDGSWWWYETKPRCLVDEWDITSSTKYAPMSEVIDWENSLQSRECTQAEDDYER
jgi:hypothetical protein